MRLSKAFQFTSVVDLGFLKETIIPNETIIYAIFGGGIWQEFEINWADRGGSGHPLNSQSHPR